MRFPAYIHPDIIVVGGLAPCNKRKSPSDGCSGESWGASYGSNLDIVAPCTRIYAATVGGGYTNSFNGTSSATPNAAGVCALLLSANPNLKRHEVEAFIYLTAEKVGAYNYDSLRLYGMWNEEMGYGSINSRLAMNMMLTGIDKVPPVIYHDNSLLSDSITGVRTTRAIIRDNRKLATGSNAPRCYYRVNNGSFSFVNASQIVGDTFKFNIPGQVGGSFVQYYFAAQDTMAAPNISTLPVGGSGINPPGTTPPTSFFSYRVGLFMIGISTKTPKICNNNSTIYDTISFTAPSNWLVTDVNVTLNVSHRTDSDVDVYLYHSSQQSELTTDNGSSGDSYWNTIFDDSASTLITSGTAPFTGRFRPETPLTAFNNSSVNGLWILRMDDDATGDFGTLDSWEIAVSYLRIQGTEPQTIIPTRYELYQNYPNPFNPITKIQFGVPKQSNVKILLYDVLGREVAVITDKTMQPGVHIIDFNTGNLSSGVYFYKMVSGDFTSIKKLVILK
jgi:subtilisin-like proprotein convertase family protein